MADTRVRGNRLEMSASGRTSVSPFAAHTAAEGAQTAGGTPGTVDTIQLAAKTSMPTTIDTYWYAPNGPGVIASTVTIEGNGAVIARAAAAPSFRFFDVSGGLPGELPLGDLTLHNLTLSGGLAKGGNGNSNAGGGSGMGGAVFNQGNVTLDSVTLAGNAAVGGDGGAGANNGGGGAGGGMGGAGFNFGGVTRIRNSTLTANRAQGGRGGDGLISHGFIYSLGGDGGSGYGGAVFNLDGNVEVVHGTLAGSGPMKGMDR